MSCLKRADLNCYLTLFRSAHWNRTSTYYSLEKRHSRTRCVAIGVLRRIHSLTCWGWSQRSVQVRRIFLWPLRFGWRLPWRRCLLDRVASKIELLFHSSSRPFFAQVASNTIQTWPRIFSPLRPALWYNYGVFLHAPCFYPGLVPMLNWIGCLLGIPLRWITSCLALNTRLALAFYCPGSSPKSCCLWFDPISRSLLDRHQRAGSCAI